MLSLFNSELDSGKIAYAYPGHLICPFKYCPNLFIHNSSLFKNAAEINKSRSYFPGSFRSLRYRINMKSINLKVFKLGRY